MRFHYETITGVFEQDDPKTEDSAFDYTNNFGLVESQSWQQLSDRISQLNATASTGTSYRLLFLGRHGEGWHNVAEARFGTKAWDAHYSLLDSYEGMRFLDAQLTERGKTQAGVDARGTFRKALAAGLPAPESYYCSPLDRCLETCSLTFSALDLPSDRPFRPKVREVSASAPTHTRALTKQLLREVIGEHTCDKRSSRSYIAKTWPGFEIEPGFAEEDPFWRPDWRESDPEMDQRLRKFLDSVFEADSATFLSFTTHSGAIGALLRVLGHRPFKPPTGSVVPVLVKVTKALESKA